MFERYTEKARRVIFFARYEASHYRSSQTELAMPGVLRTIHPKQFFLLIVSGDDLASDFRLAALGVR